MSRNPWSGLAPAVNAHLSRWGFSRRAFELTQPLFSATEEMAGGTEEEIVRRAVRQLDNNDLGNRWLTFAKSYGLPDANGVPVPAIVTTEREDNGWLNLNQQDGATVSGREQFDHTQDSLLQGILMIRREYEMLDKAVTHYVSAEVCDEVTLAAELAHPEALYETDLITPAGFAVLEKPLRVMDLHVDTGLPDPRVHVLVRAVGWHAHRGIMSPVDGTVGNGVTLFVYTTPEDHLNGYVKDLAATGNEQGAAIQRHAAKVMQTQQWAGVYDIDGPFMPIEVIPWRFGAEWSPKPDDVYRHIPGTVPSPVAFQRRWFYAFQRLMWQQIIVRHPTREVSRQVSRKWQRMAEKKQFLDYKVLRLRRLVDPNYKPSGMGDPLDHRVKVRAHWQFSYCASLGGPARLPDGRQDPSNHRWVWIEEYWKGPEDGPMGPWHPATAVVR